MRLICPNCGAQYEVDDSVIPEQGRDVQCSNCGHTWFQQPAHKDQDTADEIVDVAEADLGDLSDQTYDDADDAQPELDPDIAQVLREEAAFEAAARQAGTDGGLETQPDLGIDAAAEAAAARTAAARARMARMRGGVDAELAPAPAPDGPRKDLLPDVEEINSSLRPTSDREAPDSAGSLSPVDGQDLAEAKRSGGASRLVFRMIVVLALVALLVYVFAPQIVAQVPQAEPYLVPYVDAVNGVRAQIDPAVAGLVEQVQGLIGGGEAESSSGAPASDPATEDAGTGEAPSE